MKNRTCSFLSSPSIWKEVSRRKIKVECFEQVPKTKCWEIRKWNNVIGINEEKLDRKKGGWGARGSQRAEEGMFSPGVPAVALSENWRAGRTYGKTGGGWTLPWQLYPDYANTPLIGAHVATHLDASASTDRSQFWCMDCRLTKNWRPMLVFTLPCTFYYVPLPSPLNQNSLFLPSLFALHFYIPISPIVGHGSTTLQFPVPCSKRKNVPNRLLDFIFVFWHVLGSPVALGTDGFAAAYFYQRLLISNRIQFQSPTWPHRDFSRRSRLSYPNRHYSVSRLIGF